MLKISRDTSPFGFVERMLGRSREPPVQPMPDSHEDRHRVRSRFRGRVQWSVCNAAQAPRC